MMDSQAIRVMVMDADPGGGHALQDILEKVKGIEVEVVARNKRRAISELKAAQTEVLLIDLMLPGYRSIEVIRHVSDTLPETHILALSPGDPPHDRINLIPPESRLSTTSFAHLRSHCHICIRSGSRKDLLAAPAAGISLPIAALGLFVGMRAWSTKISKESAAPPEGWNSESTREPASQLTVED